VVSRPKNKENYEKLVESKPNEVSKNKGRHNIDWNNVFAMFEVAQMKMKFGIFYTLSQLIWTRLKSRKSIILKLASRMHKMHIFSVILQNFPGGMNSDLPRVVVPSALPLKLICDVTRFWWHFVLPLEIFCIHHWMYLFSVDQPHFVYYQRC